MKNNVTELVFIVDKSGSMAGLEKDTIGGFNSMLQKQKNEEGVCYISTVFFSELSEVIHNRINIKEVEPLTEKDYVAGGCTALLNALGDAIKHITNVQKYAASDQKADNVIFVIITDGEENSSHKYSIREIKKMISSERARNAVKIAKPSSGYMQLMLVPVKWNNGWLTYIEGKMISRVKSGNTKLFAKLKANR